MKMFLLTAAAALTLSASAAFAADLPNQDPFRRFVPGQVMTQPRSLADQGSAAYPDPANFPSFAPLALRPLPAHDNERIVESANSLPRNFEQGTVPYTQGQALRHAA